MRIDYFKKKKIKLKTARIITVLSEILNLTRCQDKPRAIERIFGDRGRSGGLNMVIIRIS